MKPFLLYKQVVVFLGCLGLGARAAAQERWPLFRVYGAHGALALRKTDAAKETAIRKGDYIYAGETLVIKDNNSELILFDKDTNYIKLDKKNEYATDAVLAMKKEHVRESVSARYAIFFFDEFLKIRGTPGLKNADIEHSTGGVSRGLIQVIAPSLQYKTSMNNCVFRWKKTRAAGLYHFSMSAGDGKVLFNKMLADTMLVLHLPDSLVKGNQYQWYLGVYNRATAKEEKVSGRLWWVDEEKTAPLLHVTQEEGPGGIFPDLRLARLYEENGCMHRADALYRSLLQKYPGDDAVKQLYHDFVKDNDIVQDEK